MHVISKHHQDFKSCSPFVLFQTLNDNFLFVIFLQSGPDPALHQGGLSDPEDLPHVGGQTIVPHDPPGHRHYPGLHQGHPGTPQIQTGQQLVSEEIRPHDVVRMGQSVRNALFIPMGNLVERA